MSNSLVDFLSLRPAHNLHVRDDATTSGTHDVSRQLVVVKKHLEFDLLRLAQLAFLAWCALPVTLL